MADLDGLEEILLAKDWDETPAETRVRIDPGRASWLRAHGYEAGSEVEPTAKASRKRAKAPAENSPADTPPDLPEREK